jgi:hypothetical protein
MNSDIFDELRQLVATAGPAPAIDRLCDWLRQQGDYHSLFYALLMKKRQELGVNPVPTAPTQELPESVKDSYEEAIRAACRLVGGLCLEAGNIPQAWVFFRMINEPGPVAAALERHQPKENDDLHPLVQIAYYEGVHPRKGFDWILDRFGLCNAITTLSSQAFPHGEEARQHCIRRLVRNLYDELAGRLAAEIARREGTPPESRKVRELMAGRPELFAEEFAHVDTSHLSSVVQMSVHLTPGEELQMARELCDYGQKIATRLRYAGDPPFEDQYRDYGVYLSALAGEDVDSSVEHFRTKVETYDRAEVGTYPAEVLVNLLLRLNRLADAVALSRQYLAAVNNRQLTCPSLVELCQEAKDYGTLAEAAREQGDTVHFTAGLIAARERD